MNEARVYRLLLAVQQNNARVTEILEMMQQRGWFHTVNQETHTQVEIIRQSIRNTNMAVEQLLQEGITE